MLKVFKYSISDKADWNYFIRASKNSHFMFYREFMDYHSDRFEDASLIFKNDKNKIVAVLPANLVGNVLYSHQGLTFAGLVVDKKVTTPLVKSVFDALCGYMKEHNFEKLIYKRVPDFYCEFHTQDDLYALFLKNAALVRRDINSTVDLSQEYSFSKGRKWSINKAKKENLEIFESDEYSDFWNVLSNALLKHGAYPTHSVEEIVHLKGCFPENIKLYLVKKENEIIAGTVLFINNNVVHTQYMATSDIGREIGALDYLISYLMKAKYNKMKYFDFGISTEQSGKILNEGLLAQKNGFGAKTTVHDFYEITLI